MDGDIPDDFFDELVDTEYIDELVESQRREAALNNISPNDGSGSGGDSPQLARCLAEIDELQRKIQRRKRKLERDLTAHRQDPADSDPEHSRDQNSRERDRERRARERRSRSGSPSHRPRGGTGESHFRRRSRSPAHHNRHRNRRSRSRSPRGHHRGGHAGGVVNRNNAPSGNRASSHPSKSLSFLEELAQTFAERGQDFPEKDLLMQPQGGPMHGSIDTSTIQNMNIYYPGLQHQYQNPPVAPAGFPHPAGYYGINPMAMHSERFAMPPAPMQNANNLHEIPPNFGACAFLDDSLERSAEAEILGKELNSGLGPVESVMEAISVRCASAIKHLRAEENKVPKQRFVFTRTSSCRLEDNEILSPLESRLNPTFRFNSANQMLSDGIKGLPTQTKAIAHILGLNSGYIFAKLRAKEIAEEIDVEVNKKETANAEAQTVPYVCDTCEERDRRTFMSRGTQIFEKEKNTTAAQTDGEEYRQPLAQMMARLTSVQLKAVRDFASILVAPQPQSPADMFNVREQIMDAYKLAQGNGRGGSIPIGTDAGYRGGSGSNYSDRSRDRGDMDQRFPPNKSRPFNSNHNMEGFDRGGGGPRRQQDFDTRGGPIEDDYRRDEFQVPPFEMDQRRNMDYVDERRIADERERERLRFLAEEEQRLRILEERQMEEEHLRQQELIHREDMEMERLRLMNEEMERREQERRFEQDLNDFNRESPDRQGIGRPGAPFNNQWTRGEGSRRSRGAWKQRGRGRGR